MKIFFIHLFLVFLLFGSCNSRVQTPTFAYAGFSDSSLLDTLYRVPLDYEFGDPFAYLNAQGDTLIPLGRFELSVTDTLIGWGKVMENVGEQYQWMGINTKGERLYEILTLDNGPDYLSDNRFRIKQYGKIGFANAKGQIVIAPKYGCAFPFEEARAKVAIDCKQIKEGEHIRLESENWFYIDTLGQKIE